MESIYYNFLNHYQGSYTKRILDEAIVLLGNLWPYLVAGIILTTIIKLFLSKAWIGTFFRGNRNISILFAALIGVVAPLGSYVVIPLTAALFTLGVPLPVLMALLVSSPLIDPTLFMLTAGAFGMKFALVRLASAFLLGLIAGYGTLLLINFRFIKIETIVPRESELSMPVAVTPETSVSFRQFGRELYRMTVFISKYFFLAIVLAALIKILTPPNLMIRIFGSNSIMAVVASTGAGIPFYVCGGAAIPVIQQLADLGLSQGAALAFFISGPITKISNLVLMHSAFSFRIFLLYFCSGIFGALFFGLLYNLLF
jgi:uncharacterized membrane protein YraQ (UPF0718 family)